MSKKFDYQGAKKAGYSDEEIQSHLRSLHPSFDVESAQEAGYSPEEINQHLSIYKPKRSLPSQVSRLGMQAALSTAERAALPYELAVAPLSSKDAQHAEYRKNVFEDIERLQEQKQMGIWDESDQELYDSLVEQIKHPEKAEKFVKTADLSIRGLTEKATGIDTHPEGMLEKAVSWVSFIRKPSNAKELIKTGSHPKQLIKSILPSSEEALRGVGAATALQMAEENKLGPIGSIASAIVGDMLGGRLLGAAKGIGKAITSPKQALAKGISRLFTKSDKLDIQKQIIDDFRSAGLQPDLGTITDNRLIQNIQARLASSGLTGQSFEEFRKNLTQQVVDQYKNLADSLGEARFSTIYEANETGKELLSKIRDQDLNEIRSLYKDARNLSKGKEAVLATPKLARSIAELEAEMSPGAVKSPQSQKVLSELDKLKTDIYDEAGSLKPASLEALINNKINLSDIADYDVQGGSKQLLKGIIKDIDTAIREYGAVYDKKFLKSYAGANERFKQHAQTFRNENLNKILTSEDPSHVLRKMDSVHGIKDLRKSFGTSQEGKKAFNDLARFKMDEIIGKNMVDGTSNQIKLGTFSNLLDKGSRRQIIQELLDPEAYKSLVRLQKSVGRLYDSSQKFYNASKSGTVVIDANLLNKVANIPLAVAGLASGNYWLLGPYATIGSMLGLSKLMTNAKFLKVVEDSILASQRGDKKLMQKAADALSAYAKEISPAVTSETIEGLKESE